MPGTIRDVYLENRVFGASPVELLCMLHTAAVEAVRRARASLGKGDIAGRARAIARAQEIVNELDCSLDREQGGEIAARLGQLYEYMRHRLTSANLEQTDAPLAEVERLLCTLREAWQGVEAELLAAAP